MRVERLTHSVVEKSESSKYGFIRDDFTNFTYPHHYYY
jgi:hypothetical protein